MKKWKLEAAKKEIDGIVINVQDIGPGNQNLIFARSVDAFLSTVGIFSIVEHYLKPYPVAEIRTYSSRLSDDIAAAKRTGSVPASEQVEKDSNDLPFMETKLKSILAEELRQTIQQIESAAGVGPKP
jgi:hypothetical protein